MFISIVPDSNVFMKLLYEEHDSNEAKVFFKTCAQTDTKLIVPELFKYEIAEVTRYYQGSLNKTLQLFKTMEKALLTVVSPTTDMWLLAEEITQKGHRQSGYPSIYDSIYHAIAIINKATFLTSDKKHYAKSKDFGNIQL